MKCVHCGFSNVEEANFCSGCGKPLEKEIMVVENIEPHLNTKIETDSKKFKLTKKGLFLLCSFLFVLTLFGTLTYLQSLPTPLERAIEAYELDEFEDFEVARKRFSSSELSEFNDYLVLEGQEVLDLYKKDAIYYKDALRKIDHLKAYGLDVALLTPLINEVESLHLSRSAFEEGKIWIDAKEWENAKKSFASVIETDPNYDSAQRYLASIDRWKLQEIVGVASDYFDEGNYDAAIAELEKALAIDPTNQTVLKLINDIEQAKNQPPVVEDVEDSLLEEDQDKGFFESLGDSITSLFDSLFKNNN